LSIGLRAPVQRSCGAVTRQSRVGCQFEGAPRLFQRSAASVTVGAVGPNAQQLLHATNFGSRSPLIQTSEPAQKGQGRSDGAEAGSWRCGSAAELSSDFAAMLARSRALAATGTMPCTRQFVRRVRCGQCAPTSRPQSRSGLSTAFSTASILSRRRSISSCSLGPGHSSRRLSRCCFCVNSSAIVVIGGGRSGAGTLSTPRFSWRSDHQIIQRGLVAGPHEDLSIKLTHGSPVPPNGRLQVHGPVSARCSVARDP
jgi:hypothetical protein